MLSCYCVMGVIRGVVEKYLKNLLGEDTIALHMVEKTDKYKALIAEKDKLVYKASTPPHHHPPPSLPVCHL